MEQTARIGQRKEASNISGEWDRLATDRHRQITSGLDVSFSNILKPEIMRSIRALNVHNIADIGCGSGTLSAELSNLGYSVVGIDFSGTSIQIAKSEYIACETLRFICANFIEWSASIEPGDFDACVANMSLTSMPDLSAACAALSRITRPGGAVIATIPHPLFWPQLLGL